MDIKTIIVEELQSLNEGLSDIIYHYTYLGNLMNILKTNKLNTSNNIGTTADAQKDKGRAFYFSTQRTKGRTGYAYAHGANVALVLDGRKLMSRYKGFPTDYWNWSMNPKDYSDKNSYIQALQSKEMEDRIVTDKPYIENASDYIMEIHINLTRGHTKKSELQRIQALAQQKQIPIYFYDDEQSYQLQNKKSAKSLDAIETDFRDEDEEDYQRGNRDFYWMFKELVPYIFYDTRYESQFWQLFKKFLDSQDKINEFDSYKQEIDKRTNEVSDFYRKPNYKYWYYLEDKYGSWMADFHNKKSSTDPYYREFLRLLVLDMRDFKADNLKTYLINKLGLKSD